MTQIIDIFTVAAEEISGLSPSTQVMVFFIFITALVLSALKAYENFKELKNIIKERKEDKKRWDQVLKKAEQELEYVSTIINRN